MPVYGKAPAGKRGKSLGRDWDGDECWVGWGGDAPPVGRGGDGRGETVGKILMDESRKRRVAFEGLEE